MSNLFFTGMLKTGLTQRYLIYTYPTGPHSRLPICPVTAPPKQQMNKCRVDSSVASVPHSTATMRNTCWSKIILPGALRVYRQVRNEKYRSVRRTIPCRLQARSPQSEEKVLIQTHYNAMLPSLSQHSRNEKNELTKYTSTVTKSGRHSHNEKQYPCPGRLSIFR